MAVPDATITKNIALASDGWRRTAYPDGSLPESGPSAPPEFTTTTTSTSITANITAANGATSYEVSVDGVNFVAGLTIGSLTAGQTYPFWVKGKNEFGSALSDPVNVTTNAASGATQIFLEDFEGTLKSGSTLANGAEVVSNQPYAGTKCCRVNLKDSANDPFIAAPSNAATYEYNGDVLVNSTATVRTVRVWFRFDDATWDGTSGAIPSPGGSKVNLKAGYWGPAGAKVSQGFYVVFDGGDNGSLRWGDNDTNDARGDGDWYNIEPWSLQSSAMVWLSTGVPFGAGTGWFYMDVVVDRSPTDYHKVKIKINGTAATGSATDAGGWLRVPKTWDLEEFSTSYTNDNVVDLSSDRTETACGIQFDNIEIFEGEPA